MELGGEYALFLDLNRIGSTAEEKAVVAHEAGHIFTGSTHAVASPYDLVARHEEKANRWAIRYLLPFASLQAAMAQGCTGTFELAERFDVPEDLMRMALRYYTEACGLNFNTALPGGIQAGERCRSLNDLFTSNAPEEKKT